MNFNKLCDTEASEMFQNSGYEDCDFESGNEENVS